MTSYICSAADVTLKFQSDAIIYTTNLTASRLHEILRYNILSNIKMGPKRPSHIVVFQSNLKLKLCNTLVHNILGQSQQNFAHATTVTLLCSTQNFVVNNWVHFKPEHCKFWSNLIEISLVGRAPDLWQIGCFFSSDYPALQWRYDY